MKGAGKGRGIRGEMEGDQDYPNYPMTYHVDPCKTCMLLSVRLGSVFWRLLQTLQTWDQNRVTVFYYSLHIHILVWDGRVQVQLHLYFTIKLMLLRFY